MKLKEIPLNDIDFGNRVRKDYGDIKELITSFNTEGIIQPLAVMEVFWSPDDGDEPAHKYLLLAGGRRYTAAKEAKIEKVPVRIYDKELSQSEIKSIELAENIYRKDLDWKEEVKLKKEIWDLQKDIHGEKTSRNPDDPGTSKREVAKLVGESASVFSEDIALAQVMDSVPILKDAKSKTEAKKIFNKLKDDVIKKEIANRISTEKRESTTDKLRQRVIDGYILGDFFKGVAKIEKNTIDIVEIDPPYGIDLTDQKKSTDSVGLSTLNYNEVDREEYEEFLTNVVKESYRVMKDGSWMIMWFGPDPWFNTVYKIMKDVGLQGNALPAVWLKGQGQTNAPNYYMGNSYEMFFYARKGNIQLNQKGRSNSFDFRPVPPSHKIHPTERPVELIQEVLDVFGYKGATVMIPFLGSGNTLLAANNKDMNGFGFELSEAYKNNFTVKVHDQIPGMFRSY